MLKPSYWKIAHIHNHMMHKLHAKGRSVVVFFDRLTDEEKSWISTYGLIWAPKPKKKGEIYAWGRICVNLSEDGPGFHLSLNAGLDLDAYAKYYPKFPLGKITEFADLLNGRKDSEPKGTVLVGGRADVDAAFQQFTYSVEAALNRSTMIDVGGRSVVIFHVVGIFGDAYAGFCYDIYGEAVTWLHSRGYTIFLTVRYSDDYALGNSIAEAPAVLDDLVVAMVTVMGDRAVDLSGDKILIEGTKGTFIGFEYDLESGTMAPKRRACVKMYYYLFECLPDDACDESVETKVHTSLLHTIASTITYYAVVIPAGATFVYSLFKCLNTKHTWSFLSVAAKRDIAWWREIIRSTVVDPRVMGRKISSMGDYFRPSLRFVSDASTTVGGGGWIIALDRNGWPKGKILRQGFIRWEEWEIRMFIRDGISINVLEFFTMMYFMLSWADITEHNVIEVALDNSASVAWANCSRGPKGSPAGESLVRVFVHACLRLNIIPRAEHIEGIVNIRADLLSRLTYLQEGKTRLEKDGVACCSKMQPRQAVLRSFLRSLCPLVSPPPYQSVLAVVTALT